MTEAADLVFKGSVVEVKYKTSKHNVPFTFVTYQVSSVLSGIYSESSITLRFLGGSKGNGEFMYSPHIPLFDLGEEDVLFVKNNTVAACPLVGCANGRLRVINEKIYSEEGESIVADPNNGSFYKGLRESLAVVDNHNMDGILLSSISSTDPNDHQRKSNNDTNKLNLSTERLIEVLADIKTNLGSKSTLQKGSSNTPLSANIDAALPE